MLFSSVEFALFLPLVFFLYWLVFNKSVGIRNWFLLGVSYFFYGMWDWRFLSLIVLSSFVDYFLGRKIYETQQVIHRKAFLIASVVVNIGILGFFKYFNFFVESFVASFKLFGFEFGYTPLNIILPVGISFYTFQTMSYTLDIYYRKLKPTNNIVSFFAFVSFFPQLVAGPIERAKHLLPQFSDLKSPNYAMFKSGLLLIGLGLFKKIVIADRLAIFVDSVYQNPAAASGLVSVLAVLFFAFQLYLDFSAYSEIAIGTARTLGFDLSTNFRRPYLSNSFSDFWSRWHISLSSWFRDYVYIPLGGNKSGNYKTTVNIIIVFLISGLWHGASWNFVIWGAFNAMFLLVFDRLFSLVKENLVSRMVRPIVISLMWAFSLVFFRATSFHDSLIMFGNLGFGNVELLYEMGLNSFELGMLKYLLIGLVVFEIINEKWNKISEWFNGSLLLVRWSVYLILVAAIIMFGSYGAGLNDQNFIYFQF